jgi:hypothetical protein
LESAAAPGSRAGAALDPAPRRPAPEPALACRKCCGIRQWFADAPTHPSRARSRFRVSRQPEGFVARVVV